MIIDRNTYKLSTNNYINVETDKRQIVIGNTFNNDMRHFNGWLKRYNGNYKKTASFTITSSGKVYQHFDPKYYSNYFKDDKLNKKSIIILLENYGWLLKNVDNNEFITWIGDIYKEADKVVEKRWRGYNFWAPYTKKQFNVATELVKSLCDEFLIPLTVMGHNTKIDDFILDSGVLYKSNLEKFYTDVNPSWDFELFKTKIEEK